MTGDDDDWQNVPTMSPVLVRRKCDQIAYSSCQIPNIQWKWQLGFIFRK